MLPNQIQISSLTHSKVNLLTISCGEEKHLLLSAKQVFREASAHKFQNSLIGFRKAFLKTG